MAIDLLNRKWDSSKLTREATSSLNVAIKAGIPIALYGAGQTGSLVAKSLQGSAAFFIDDTPEKHGQALEGISVLSAEQAFKEYGQNLLVVVCIFSAKHRFLETKKCLEDRFGWHVCTFVQALFLNQNKFDYLYLEGIEKQSQLQDEYIKIFKNLADERSKDVLIDHLNARLLADFSGSVDSRTELSFLGLASDAIVSFADCGAYDGDTVQDFIEWRGGNFGRILALEPDPANFKKLTDRVSKFPYDYKRRIELWNMAVWLCKGKTSFLSSQSVGSCISDQGNNLVSTETLDRLLPATDPLIIKLDVEGEEWEAVTGALEFIRAKRPILAISVYHKPNDLIDLFNLIASLNVGYKFFLRCHGGDGTDLTLYCLPLPVNDQPAVSRLLDSETNVHAGPPPELSNLTFDGFRQLASDVTLSRHTKVGFPDSYRDGKEYSIFLDVKSKLTSLNSKNSLVLEIGPGCSLLPVILASHCRNHEQQLVLVDSQEMLSLLPDARFIEKIAGRFPHIDNLFNKYKNKINSIIAYSVIQYVFAESNLWDFLDCALSLLTDGGEMLLGDIPNMTMRKRFFSSAAGIQCHREYTGRDELPVVHFNQLEPGQIDDSVVIAILSRARSQGFHAWVLPQAVDLPMANRREDILIRKP